jgi:hypothetical protein
MGEDIKNGEVSTDTKKLSYEQLEQFAVEASQQMQRMQQELAVLRDNRAIVRLEFLFKVIENREVFGDAFTDIAIKEIMAALPPIEEVKTEKEGE